MATHHTAESIARALGGKRTGRGWQCRCPAHQDRDPSLSLADGRDGKVLLTCFAGCSFDAIRDALARRGIDLGGSPIGPIGPIVKANTERERAEQADVARRTAAAQALWREGVLWAAEPVARRYLLDERGLSLPDDYDGILYHPACSSPVGIGPAIVAPLNDSTTGYVVGVWRIRLTPEGKKVGRYGLGPMRGNASRLVHETGDRIALTEGVEDALAYWLLTGAPCWAALSAGNLQNVVLPERHRRVTIVADADKAGLDAAKQAARKFKREGRDVAIVAPPAGIKDANDALRARAA